MADPREVFSILETTTGEGAGLSRKVAGNAPGGDNEAPVLGHLDNTGNLTHGPVKQVGDAPADAGPALVALDSGGNLGYLKLNAAGELVVSDTAEGAKLRSRVQANGIIDTDVTLSTITLSNSTTYTRPEMTVSASKETYWRLRHNDNGTPAILADAYTGPGMFTFAQLFENLEFISGATGAQTLDIIGVQQRSPVTPLRTNLQVLEL
jgi:hypothetical protein